MQLRFVKMQGLGNDFMVVEWPPGAPPISSDRVIDWADRRLGVGFDSLLLVDRSPIDDADASYRVLNADGGEAEQCGNGARCIARYLTAGRPGRLSLRSAGGTIAAEVGRGDRVRIDLGEPDFRPESLPFVANGAGPDYTAELATGIARFRICSMGNPHAVIAVESVDDANVAAIGAALGRLDAFPAGVNVGFAEQIDTSHLKLRVHERGVGETLACGTGAAAAVAVGRRYGNLEASVDVQLPGGVLAVSWPGPGEDLWQTGPATTVYEGTIEL